jgi:hypothetical protein
MQSDTASCLASHDIIAYVHQSDKEPDGLGLTVVQWIYTEALTERSLDTHFSFVSTVVNVMSKAEMISGRSSKFMTPSVTPVD